MRNMSCMMCDTEGCDGCEYPGGCDCCGMDKYDALEREGHELRAQLTEERKLTDALVVSVRKTMQEVDLYNGRSDISFIEEMVNALDTIKRSRKG